MGISVELIETLWNVNLVIKQLIGADPKELIETLWNVNSLFATFPPFHGKRINRNIVECKYKQDKVAGKGLSELIETLWNVNNFLMIGAKIGIMN